MMMINLDCAKNLLDMWVLMLQNQWKKNEKKNLSQFWENHNFVNFPSIEAKQFKEQPKQSSFALADEYNILCTAVMNTFTFFHFFLIELKSHVSSSEE